MSLLKKITKTVLMLAAFASIVPLTAVTPKEFKIELLPFVRQQAEETTYRLVSRQLESLNKQAEEYLKVPEIPTKNQLRRQAVQDWFVKWEGSNWKIAAKIATSVSTAGLLNVAALACAKLRPEYVEPTEFQDATRAASSLTLLALQTYIAEKVGANKSFTINDILTYVESIAKKQAHSSQVAELKAFIRKAVAETPEEVASKAPTQVVEEQEGARTAQLEAKVAQATAQKQAEAIAPTAPSMQEFFS